MWGRVHSQIVLFDRAIVELLPIRLASVIGRIVIDCKDTTFLQLYNMQINGWLLCGWLPSFIAFSVKFWTSSHFPFRAFSLFYIFPFGRIFTPVCHFVYITLFRHFVYAILFKSLRLLRLHLMQASALPSLVASITFGYYLDSGSTRAADNSVYAWHIYMFSPCFPLNFVFSRVCFVHF